MLSIMSMLTNMASSLQPSNNPWARGESAVLTVEPSGAMTLHSSGGADWSGAAAQGCGTAGSAATSSGRDWLGAYDQLDIGTQCMVRYYSSSDAFVFERHAGSIGKATQWPLLTMSAAAEATTTARALSWEPSWMLPGALIDLNGAGRSDGPLMVFDAASSNRTGTTLVLSALDHFAVNAPQYEYQNHSDKAGIYSMWMSSEAVLYPMQNKTLAARVLPPPSGTAMRSVLLARSELKRATLAWGSFQRRYHNTTRSRSTGTGQLSYWDDNAAGYSFWSNRNLDVWGPPQDIYTNLKASYAKQGIPVRQWEIDPRGIHDPKVFTSYGWCYLDWLSWNVTLFPSGGDKIKEWLLDNKDRAPDTGARFRQKITLEDAIGFHAFAPLEALLCCHNAYDQCHSSRVVALLPVGTVHGSNSEAVYYMSSFSNARMSALKAATLTMNSVTTLKPSTT
jgi:hypothetical protein